MEQDYNWESEYKEAGSQNKKGQDLDAEMTKRLIGQKAYVMYPKVVDTSRIVFSGFGMLFGVIYYIYRKCYLTTILFWLASGVLTMLFGRSLAAVTVIMMLTWIAQGLLFYPAYQWELNRKVRMLKMTGWNEPELLYESERRGGVNMTGAVIFSIVAFLGAFL